MNIYQLNTLSPTTLAALVNAIVTLDPDCPLDNTERNTLQDISKEIVAAGVLNCGDDFFQLMANAS